VNIKRKTFDDEKKNKKYEENKKKKQKNGEVSKKVAIGEGNANKGERARLLRRWWW